jgi:hypothetical protein
MSELEIFLNCLIKSNYPSERTSSIAKVCDYDIDNFLLDLYKELGKEKTNEFVKKTFDKILRNNLFCYDLTEYPSGGNVCVEIKKIDIDFETHSIRLSIVWGPTKILDENGNQKTIQEIIDEADFSEWSSIEDFLDSILSDIQNKLYKLTGFEVTID